MSVDPALEDPQPVEGDGFSDAVTVAFGDERAEVYGLARVGFAGDRPTGLAILFDRREVAAVRAGAGEDGGTRAWEAAQAAGVTTSVVEPLRAWRAGFDGGATEGFDLELEALGEPARLDGGGMQAYESLCRVRGSVRAGGREVRVDCLGQRGHAWGTPDWKRISLARTVGAWLDDGLGVLLSSVRPAKAREHDEEQVTAAVLAVPHGDDEAAESAGVVATPVLEPLLSTAYDGGGHQRRAGFELWEHEEARAPRRGAGEVVCGTSLDLGELRLDCAFFRWRMEGRAGLGRYDILRRTADTA